MKAQRPVETPHRIPGTRLDTQGRASVRGPRDAETQRGVSTKGPVLFKGRFRVQSTRLPGWDYRSNGYYFVTICTKDRAPFLGDIADGRMCLSSIGEIIAAEWRGIAVRRRDVSLDEWVVMPNHIHGIVVVARDRGVETPQRERARGAISDGRPLTRRRKDDAMQRGVSTGIPPRLQAGSLGTITGQFKSRSTKRAWQLGFQSSDGSHSSMTISFVMKDPWIRFVSTLSTTRRSGIRPRGCPRTYVSRRT